PLESIDVHLKYSTENILESLVCKGRNLDTTKQEPLNHYKEFIELNNAETQLQRKEKRKPVPTIKVENVSIDTPMVATQTDSAHKNIQSNKHPLVNTTPIKVEPIHVKEELKTISDTIQIETQQNKHEISEPKVIKSESLVNTIQDPIIEETIVSTLPEPPIIPQAITQPTPTEQINEVDRKRMYEEEHQRELQRRKEKSKKKLRKF
ncbi:hypothetical protein HDV02_005132, partial [Globomyces sp. JEL0801]